MHNSFGLTSIQGRSVSNASTDSRHEFAPREDQAVHTFLDAKLMAQSLRQALAVRKIALSHSDCLELVAKQFGLANWNVLAARIEATTDTSALRLPRHWSITNQTDQKHYRLGLDPLEAGTALIESRFQRGSGVDLSGDNYACLMQSVLADNLTGQRVKLSASIRTEDADAASIWMRVDRAPGNVLRFDNMLHRQEDAAVRGTQRWTECSIVLDVPRDAASIHYGLLLKGHGRVWARQFHLEPVGDDVATTAGHGRYLDRPSNLGFAEGRPDA